MENQRMVVALSIANEIMEKMFKVEDYESRSPGFKRHYERERNEIAAIILSGLLKLDDTSVISNRKQRWHAARLEHQEED